MELVVRRGRGLGDQLHLGVRSKNIQELLVIRDEWCFLRFGEKLVDFSAACMGAINEGVVRVAVEVVRKQICVSKYESVRLCL